MNFPTLLLLAYLLLPAVTSAQLPDWNAVTGAPSQVAGWTASGAVTADTSTVAEGTESMRFEAAGASMSAYVQTPGELSFRWKLWADAATAGWRFPDVSGSGFTISGRRDWGRVTMLVPPGGRLLQWYVSGGGQTKTSALWVDDIRFEALNSVSLEDATEASGVTLQGSGWQGLTSRFAQDGTDAAWAQGTSTLTISASGPGWLDYFHSSNPVSWRWVARRVYVKPGPQTVSVTGGAVDRVRFSPQTQVAPAVAADFAGSWGASSYGVEDPARSPVGGSALVPDGAVLTLQGPGEIRFATWRKVQFSVNGSTRSMPNQSDGWVDHVFPIPLGTVPVAWGYDAGSWSADFEGDPVVDNIRYTPAPAITLAELLDTTLTVNAPTVFPGGPADSRDGVDCAFLNGGTASFSVTGPGRLTAWMMDGTLSVGLSNLQTPAADAGKWHFVSVDLASAAYSVSFAANRVDELDFQPGPTLASQLGHAGLWHFIGQAVPAVESEAGQPVLVSGSPCPGTLTLASGRSGLAVLNADIFLSTGVETNFPPGAFTPGGWKQISTTEPAFSFSGPEGGQWKVRAPSITTPVAGALPIAEALDSPLAWSAGTTSSWTTYAAEPRAGGEDVVYFLNSVPRIGATVNGPATVQFGVQGELAVRIGTGAFQTHASAMLATSSFFVPSPSVIEFRGSTISGRTGVLTGVTVIPSQWTTLPEIECDNVTVEPIGPLTSIPGIAASDGVDALSGSIRALSGQDGFLSWQQGGDQTSWYPRMLGTAAGAVSALSGRIDQLRLVPRAVVSLADGADLAALTFNAVPAGSWAGFSGTQMGARDDDALSTTALSSTSATLELPLPSAGLLTWWRHRESGFTSTQPTGTVSNSGNYWHFCHLRVTSAQTARWTASLPSGALRLDDMTWTPGASVPGPDAAMDTPGRTFVRSSATAWVTVPMAGAMDGDALYSHSGTIETTVTGPARVSFASMANRNDIAAARVLVNGSLMRYEGRGQPFIWTRSEFLLPAGSHILRWDATDSPSSFFLDDLRIEPLSPTPEAEILSALDAEGSGAGVTSAGPPIIAGAPESHDGQDAVMIAGLSGGSVQAAVPRGRRVRFWWRMPAQAIIGPGAGVFLVDGQEIILIHRDTGWREVVWDLPGTGNAALEWRVRDGDLFLDSLSLTTLPAPPQSAAVAAGWTDGAWLGNPGAAGAGWHFTDAVASDGAAAMSAGPALLDISVTGPGWLHFDYAAAGIDVLVGGEPRIQMNQSGPAFQMAGVSPAGYWRGFRTDAVEIPAGTHGVRFSSAGSILLDRLRLLPQLEPGLLCWQVASAGGVEPGSNGLPVIAASPGGSLLVRAAGPGTLTLRGSVPSLTETTASSSIRLDGLLLSGASYGARIDIPAGMHLVRVDPLRFRYSVNQLSLSSGNLEIAAAWQTSQPLQWYESNGTNSLIPPGYMASWVASHAEGSGLSIPEGVLNGRNGVWASGRSWLLTDQSVPGSIRFGSSASDLQIHAPVPTSAEAAVEALPGWTFSLPADGSWMALGGGGPVLDAFQGGDALVAARGDYARGSPVSASVSGPVNAAFRWSAPPGLSTYGMGRFLAGGLPLLTYNRTPQAYNRTAVEHCIVQGPAGGHTFAWSSTASLAVDHFTVPQGPLIGDVLEAPDLVWTLASPTGVVADHVHYEGTEDVLKIANLAAEERSSALGVLATGPGLLKCRVRADGTADVRVTYAGGQIRTVTVAAGLWQEIQIPLPEAAGITFEPRNETTLWIAGVTLVPLPEWPVAATLEEAVDAAHLDWTWSPGWLPAASTDLPLDSTGHAFHPFSNGIGTAQVRLNGAGTLSFRHSGVFRVSQGGTALLTTGPGGIASLTLTGAGEHVIVIAMQSASSAATLDAVMWTPAASLPDAASALSDADNDGVSTLLEYAAGLNPALPDARQLSRGAGAGLPEVTVHQTAAGPALQIEYLERLGLRCIPEFASAPEGPWIPAVPASVSLLDSMNPLWCRKSAVDPVPAGSGRRFARLRVSTGQ